MNAPQRPKRIVTRRLAGLMRRAGWYSAKHDNWITGRLYHLMVRGTRWWDWGHKVMILTGTCVGGNYDAPRPPTWWYRLGASKPMWRTGFPRYPLSTYQVITDYSTFRQLTEGLNEDEMYHWQAFHMGQDDELHLGHTFWGGKFFGLTYGDTALLRRYLRSWHRRNWFGVRSWIYTQALHAAVHEHKPFSCHQAPGRGSGGYTHWHCQRRKHHTGTHQYRSCTWSDGGRVERTEQ